MLPINEENSLDAEALASEIRSNLCMLSGSDWLRNALFGLAVLTVLGGTANLVFVMYRFVFYNFESTLLPTLLNQAKISYNNNTGLMYDLIAPYVPSYPGMNTSCGDDYPLLDVCANLFAHIPDNISVCADAAVMNCVYHVSMDYNLTQIPNSLSNLTACGTAYPLNSTCQFASIFQSIGGYKIVTCAWSAAVVCMNLRAYGGSYLYPDADVTFLSVLGVFLAFVFGVALGIVGRVIITPINDVNDLSQNNKMKLYVIMGKLNLEISDNNLLTTVKDALIAKKNVLMRQRHGFFSQSSNEIELKPLISTESELPLPAL